MSREEYPPQDDQDTSQREQRERPLKDQVVDELKDFFDTKLRELKRDFHADSEWVAESTRKKVRFDNNIHLKNVANRKQFMFNNEIADVIDNIEKAVSLRDSSKAREFIAEARAKIKHRNKIIRIADSSPAGWATIQEYEMYDVASDSDDDRRIRKAEERARAKIEKSNKASDNKYDNPSSASYFQQQPFRAYRRGTGRPPMAGRFESKKPIVCYKCGIAGHVASGCAYDFNGSTRHVAGDTGSTPATVGSGTESKMSDPSYKQQ